MPLYRMLLEPCTNAIHPCLNAHRAHLCSATLCVMCLFDQLLRHITCSSWCVTQLCTAVSCYCKIACFGWALVLVPWVQHMSGFNIWTGTDANITHAVWAPHECPACSSSAQICSAKLCLLFCCLLLHTCYCFAVFACNLFITVFSIASSLYDSSYFPQWINFAH